MVGGTPVRVAVAVRVRVGVLVAFCVGVEVFPPGVKVGKGVPQTPMLAVITILELLVAWVPHTHCVNLPAPSCTPIVAVPPVFIAPKMMSKLDEPSYRRISKYALPGFEK